MKQTISILGCGWLGKPLAKNLLSKAHKIKVSTTSNEKHFEFEKLGFDPYIISIDNFTIEIKDFLNTDVLVIAIPSKNIDGFKKLISEFENTNIQQIIFISSTSVYEYSDEIVDENSQLVSSPLVEIERLFSQKCAKRTTIIRFAGLFGYKRHPGKFFSKGRQIPQPESLVNMIHQDDCIGIINRIIEMKICGEVFNACADTHPTKREFYSKMIMDYSAETAQFEEGAQTIFKTVSNQKLKTILNYKFKFPDLLNLNAKALN